MKKEVQNKPCTVTALLRMR